MRDFNQDHFALFGLTPAFAVDVAALEQAYRDLQTEFHPDRFAHAGEAEQRRAVQWSTRINEAYQTLKSPFARARYLLELQGIHAMDAANTAMPAGFLVQQMEWRAGLMAGVAAAEYARRQGAKAAARAEQAGVTDPDPKALACYGLWLPALPAGERMLLRFVDGRPVSAVSCAFLAWTSERLAADGVREPQNRRVEIVFGSSKPGM